MGIINEVKEIISYSSVNQHNSKIKVQLQLKNLTIN